MPADVVARGLRLVQWLSEHPQFWPGAIVVAYVIAFLVYAGWHVVQDWREEQTEQIEAKAYAERRRALRKD